MLDSATATGKTVMAAYMIAHRKVSTLILLQNTDLIPQWVEELNRFLEIDEQPPVYHTKTGSARTHEGSSYR